MLTPHQHERFLRHWTAAQPSVANYLRAVARDGAAAEDALQETALALFRKFADYDEQRPFQPWALGIARFQALGMRRDAARSRVVFDDAVLAKFTETWAEEAAEQSDRGASLESCMERLGGHARRLVRLRYFEDLNAEEIGREIGGTGAGTIRVTLQRIREQLRACMEQHTQPEG